MIRPRESLEKWSKRFAHDPYRLAARLGVTVEYCESAALQNPKRPGVTIRGRLLNLPGQPVIQVAAELNAYEAHRTVAHELCHLLGYDDERHCDQFARRFCTLADDELPGGKWRAIQNELLERARRASRR